MQNPEVLWWWWSSARFHVAQVTSRLEFGSKWQISFHISRHCKQVVGTNSREICTEQTKKCWVSNHSRSVFLLCLIEHGREQFYISLRAKKNRWQLLWINRLNRIFQACNILTSNVDNWQTITNVWHQTSTVDVNNNTPHNKSGHGAQIFRTTKELRHLSTVHQQCVDFPAYRQANWECPVFVSQPLHDVGKTRYSIGSGHCG